MAPSGATVLGHTRLAIQDLSQAAAQPMLAGPSLGLTYNGEVYNAPALRAELVRRGEELRTRCDTEVVLRGLRCWGIEELLGRLCGMFAFVAWDDERQELVAAVDPAGMKPLTWAMAGGKLFIASTCDALLRLLPQRPSLDAEGLCHVLCHGYCPHPQTVWQGVRKLGPGQALRFRPGDAQPAVWRYWNAPEEIDADSTTDDEAFPSIWEQIAREHMLSDVPVGLFLSGGLDSTSVALALARARQRPECFTLGLDGSDDESGAAAATAHHLGLPHTTVRFHSTDAGEMLAAAADAFDEPQAYGAILTATAISRAARPWAKVVLAGDGGDEAFAGYTWHAEPTQADATLAREHAALSASVSRADADGATRSRALAAMAALSPLHAHLQRVFPRFHPAEAAAILVPLSPRYDEHMYAAWASEHDRPSLPWPRRAQRLDLMGFCAGSILPKIDRSGMSVGMEMRAPFLDRRLLDWALRRPAGDHGEPKGLVRRYLRGRVPDGVLTRPKQGFSLRLASDPWPQHLPWLRRSRLAGMLHPGWEAFVAPDAPSRSARIFALCMLAAWAERRLG
jgi:asparagine synthase (glutamine-hydrolysing)